MNKRTNLFIIAFFINFIVIIISLTYFIMTMVYGDKYTFEQKLIAGIFALINTAFYVFFLYFIYRIRKAQESSQQAKKYEKEREKYYEALRWLESNKHTCALGANRFDDMKNAADFVKRLYEAGAEYVGVTDISDAAGVDFADGYPKELKTESYADTVIVMLPPDEASRKNILEIYYSECEEYECNCGEKEAGIKGDMVSFWWD